MALLPINKRGGVFVELIITMGILALFLPVFLSGMVSSREGKTQQQQRIRATNILRETEEAVRSIKEKGWSTFAVNNIYHPAASGSAWFLFPGTETDTDGFSRSIVLSDVNRDSSGQIVQTGGTIDPSTKKATVSISWNDPYVSTISSVLYLTRYLNNLSLSKTSSSDFTGGAVSDTVISNTSGGEIILAPGLGGRAKWCEPSFSPVTVSLPETPTAVSAKSGHVYVGMGDSSGTAASFAHLLVDASTTPLTLTTHGRLNGNYQTTSVFGEDNWGYITTSNTSGKRVVIIDLNTYADPINKIYEEEGSFSVSSNTKPASSISVYNNRGYVTIGGYLYVFDLSSKSGARPQIGSRILFSVTDGTSPAKETFVRQIGTKTYIFIAVDGTYRYEMTILDVTKESDSNQWKVVGKVDIDENGCSNLQKTKGVYVKPDGSRAYISDANANDFKEFFVINTENKSNPFVVGGSPVFDWWSWSCSGGGGYEAGDMDPKQSAVTLPLENRAIMVGTGGEEYQVLELSNEAAPTRCGGLNYDSGFLGVASAQETNGDVFAYLVTGDKKLKVIEGGPDVVGGRYLPSGTYESTPLDIGYTVAFNRFSASVTNPASTEIKMQIAISQTVAGNCNDSTYQYVGPDGTNATYFTSSGTSISAPIPVGTIGAYTNPGRSFCYKVFLSTSDTNATPSFNDISLNYSP